MLLWVWFNCAMNIIMIRKIGMYMYIKIIYKAAMYVALFTAAGCHDCLVCVSLCVSCDTVVMCMGDVYGV